MPLLLATWSTGNFITYGYKFGHSLLPEWMYEATVIAQTNQWLYNFAAFFINMFLVSPRFFLFIWYSPSFLSYSICFCMSFLSHLYCDNSLPVHSECHTKEKLYNFCMSVFVNKPCQFSFLHFTSFIQLNS